MRRTFFLLFVFPFSFGFLVSCGSKTSQVVDPAVTAEIGQLIEQRFEANAAHDRTFYDDLLLPNSLILLPPPMPVSGKQQYIAREFPSGPTTPRGKASIKDLRVLADRDTAVAYYVATEMAMMGTQEIETTAHRVDTYVRRDGRWKLLSMTAALAPFWMDPIVVPAKILSAYAGTYESSSGAANDVTLEGGRLFIKLPLENKTELFAETQTLFFDKSDHPSARTEFVRSPVDHAMLQVYHWQGQTIVARKIK